VLAPFYLQNILGYTPKQMGLLYGAMSLMMFFFSPISGVLSDRLGTSSVITASLLIMFTIYSFIAIGIEPEITKTECIVAMLVLGTGMGLFMSPSHSAVMGAISNEYLGIASSLLILARTLGQVAGVSVLGAIWIGRVKIYNNGELLESLASASVKSRIQGLQDIFLFTTFLTVISCALIIGGAIQTRRIKCRT
jgi:MFS family permease